MKYKLTLPTDYDIEITAQDFTNYVDIQKSGQYNMFDPNARIAAGLTKKQFMVIMENYEELEKQYEDADVEEAEAEAEETDCPECYGTGYWEPYLDEGDRTEEDCPNCDGEGVI